VPPAAEEAKPNAEAPAEEAKAAEPEVVPPAAEDAKPSTEAPAGEANAAAPEVVPPPAEDAKPSTEAPADEANAAAPVVSDRRRGWADRFTLAHAANQLEPGMYEEWRRKRVQANGANAKQRANGTQTILRQEQLNLEALMDRTIQKIQTDRMEAIGLDTNARIQKMEGKVDDMHNIMKGVYIQPSPGQDGDARTRELRNVKHFANMEVGVLKAGILPADANSVIIGSVTGDVDARVTLAAAKEVVKQKNAAQADAKVAATAAKAAAKAATIAAKAEAKAATLAAKNAKWVKAQAAKTKG
jgi:hypothetical protein